MCHTNIGHLLHVFFDCQFATQCCAYAGISYDMQQVTSAPDWLMDKLSTETNTELIKIVEVLWGIWSWRNKRVWKEKMVSPATTIEWSAGMVSEWRQAKENVVTGTRNQKPATNIQMWEAPAKGGFKVNVDASLFRGDVHSLLEWFCEIVMECLLKGRQ